MTSLHCDIGLCRGDFCLALNLSVSGPGITALLGPSGCGKTTLLRTLAGLEHPQRGRIGLDHQVWFDAGQRIFLKPQRRRVGFMFQSYALFPHLSVIDNIAFGTPKGGRRHVADLIDRLRITAVAHCRPDQLSGGQRQRVALARALAMQPDLLLLDEPFSSVDRCLRDHLRQLLRESAVATGIPVLMATHDLDDVKEIADWAGVMGDGCLRRFGPTSEVFADPREADVARLLGWPNILPVTAWQDGEVHGPWGRLPVGAVAYAPRKTWIALSADAIRLGGTLPATVSRCLDMGSHWLVHCRLKDGTRLSAHLPREITPPADGALVGLGVADSRHSQPLQALRKVGGGQ